MVTATEIHVLYFYSSSCPVSQKTEPYEKNVSDFWKGKVDWTEYNFMVNEDRKYFDVYNIFNVPVAIVNCSNLTYRIERDEITEKLNETINNCYKLTEKPEEFSGFNYTPLLLFITFVIGLSIVALKNRKRKSKKLKH